MVGVLREAAATYDTAQCPRSIAAVMAIRDGELVVWRSPVHVVTPESRSFVETWVRLQIVRGRRFAFCRVEDIAFAALPARSEALDDAPTA